MSLYNAIMGENPAADDLLRILKLSKRGIPRYRDCWITADWQYIDLLTRTGGKNRALYAEAIELLRKLPNFVMDHDDEIDPTFMHFLYTAAKNTGPVAGNDADRGPAAMMKAFRTLKEHGLDEPHANPKLEAIRQGSLALTRKMLDALESSPSGTVIRVGEDGKITKENYHG